MIAFLKEVFRPFDGRDTKNSFLASISFIMIVVSIVLISTIFFYGHQTKIQIDQDRRTAMERLLGEARK